MNGQHKQYTDRSRTEQAGFDYPREHTNFLRYHVYTDSAAQVRFYPGKGSQRAKLATHFHLVPTVRVTMFTAVSLHIHIHSKPYV